MAEHRTNGHSISRLTNERYLRFDRNYKSTDLRDVRLGLSRWGEWRQDQMVSEMNEYTPIVDDLIDNVNQNTVVAYSGNQPVDNVTGYTLSQIQTALRNARYPDTWRNNLNRNRPSGVSTADLNTLFSYMNQALNNQQTCD